VCESAGVCFLSVWFPLASPICRSETAIGITEFAENLLCLFLITGLFCLGRAVQRFFQGPAHCSNRSNRTCSLSKFQSILRAFASGAEFGHLWQPRLETECTMRSGCPSIHRGPGSKAQSLDPMIDVARVSSATETRKAIGDPAPSRRANRVEVRNY
jgi:hypothetical protein